MLQSIFHKLAFRKVPWKPATAKFLRQSILVKAEVTGPTIDSVELQPHVSNPIPLIMQAKGPQSINAREAGKGWKTSSSTSYCCYDTGLGPNVVKEGLTVAEEGLAFLQLFSLKFHSSKARFLDQNLTTILARLLPQILMSN